MKRATLMLAVLALLLGGVGQARAGVLPPLTLTFHETGFTDVTMTFTSNFVETNVPASFPDYAGSSVNATSNNPGTAAKGFLNLEATIVANTTPQGPLVLTLSQPDFSTPGGAGSTVSVESDLTVVSLGTQPGVVSPLDPPGLSVATTATFNTTALPTLTLTFTGTTTTALPFTTVAPTYTMTVQLTFTLPSPHDTSTASATASVTPAASVPEPSTLTLLGIGSLGLLGYRWRRRK